MDRATCHVGQVFFFQHFFYETFLVDKRCNDTDGFIPVCQGIPHNLQSLGRRGVFAVCPVILYIYIDKRLGFLTFCHNFQSGIIILLIVELYYLLMTAVMIM